MTRRTSSLQREIRQTKPFRSPGHEAVLGLLRTADVVRRRLVPLVESAGVTAQQYNVLRILRGAGAAGLPTLEIAERMIEQTPGITRLVDRLEAQGFVARERSDSDRRVVACRITAAGLKLLAGLDDPVDAADSDAVAMLTRDDLRHLVRILDAIRAGRTQEPPAASKRRARGGTRAKEGA
jgi:DNA-binding MarR family transcriptional regulator